MEIVSAKIILESNKRIIMKKLAKFVHEEPKYTSILFFVISLPVGITLDVMYFFLHDIFPYESFVSRVLEALMSIPKIFFVNPVYENLMQPYGYSPENIIILIKISFGFLGLIVTMSLWLWLYYSGRKYNNNNPQANQ
jgi:hypothetical protein